MKVVGFGVAQQVGGCSQGMTGNKYAQLMHAHGKVVGKFPGTFASHASQHKVRPYTSRFEKY